MSSTMFAEIGDALTPETSGIDLGSFRASFSLQRSQSKLKQQGP